MDVAAFKEYNDAVHADAAIETACFRYLSTLGYTMWANWNIQQRERRKVAAAWWAFHTENVLDEMSTAEWVKAFSQSRWRRWRNRRKGQGWLRNWTSRLYTSASRSRKRSVKRSCLPL